MWDFTDTKTSTKSRFLYMKWSCMSCRISLWQSLWTVWSFQKTVRAFSVLNGACFSCFVLKMRILHFIDTKLLRKLTILYINTASICSHISCLQVYKYVQALSSKWNRISVVFWWIYAIQILRTPKFLSANDPWSTDKAHLSWNKIQTVINK